MCKYREVGQCTNMWILRYLFFKERKRWVAYTRYKFVHVSVTNFFFCVLGRYRLWTGFGSETLVNVWIYYCTGSLDSGYAVDRTIGAWIKVWIRLGYDRWHLEIYTVVNVWIRTLWMLAQRRRRAPIDRELQLTSASLG